jgi:hypothetical protein
MTILGISLILIGIALVSLGSSSGGEHRGLIRQALMAPTSFGRSSMLLTRRIVVRRMLDQPNRP